ncbi:DUF2478 domain-containing protein [Roseovarius sp. 2305UL8-3]|uniref:DUF2478 domain-containing protein n=1 Tax=Roseovarius conchicola TaxID=3121636 RepID=UPI003528D51B
MTYPMPRPAAITALIRDKGQPVDPMLHAAANLLRDKGMRVAGVAQQARSGRASCCDDFSLVNLATGARHCISQDLGSGSKGCRLDYGTLAEAIAEISTAITPDTDVLILNRFGYSESQGGGFRPLVEKALGLNIPVLLSVTRSYHDDWRAYAGSYATDLPATSPHVRQWCDAILRASVKIGQEA